MSLAGAVVLPRQVLDHFPRVFRGGFHRNTAGDLFADCRIEKALKEFRALNITPKISVLSGGRNSDIGRDALVDLTIKMAIDLVEYFQDNYPNIMINHDEILIENAVTDNCNLILAPNGISGNLIYRTLVHLGEGKAYGAIYMDMGHIIIDTSSVGEISEIYGALILSLALTP